MHGRLFPVCLVWTTTQQIFEPQLKNIGQQKQSGKGPSNLQGRLHATEYLFFTFILSAIPTKVYMIGNKYWKLHSTQCSAMLLSFSCLFIVVPGD